MKKVIIFGGANEEHFVSLASAKNICGLYKFDKHLYVNLSGAVYHVPKEAIIGYAPDFKTGLCIENHFDHYPNIDSMLIQDLDESIYFIAMHGKAAEDGVLQKLLEKYSKKFTGSDSKSSATCFNKLETLLHLESYGIKSAPRMMSGQWDLDLARVLFGDEKLIAKPVANGSSVSLHFLDSIENFNAQDFLSEDYLIEKRIFGREFTCGVIQDSNGSIQALSPVEILTEIGEFSYGAKYLSDKTNEICPAVIDSDLLNSIQSVSALAHKTLGCFGYSRADFIFDGKNLYFLEINTLPGLTSRSLLTLELKNAGISLSEFIDGQIRLALCRPNNIY